MYISRGVFKQRVVKTETGSSTMPQSKPDRLRNAEGNLLPMRSLRILPTSCQSRVCSAISQFHRSAQHRRRILAITFCRLNLYRRLKKLSVDSARIKEELDTHPEIYTETIQTVMRQKRLSRCLRTNEALSRGQKVTIEKLL